MVDGGSEKGLQIFGICAETTWPFEVADESQEVKWLKNVSTPPAAEAYTEARGSRAVIYSRLDPDHPGEVEDWLDKEERTMAGVDTLMQLKQRISEGYPVVFGFWYYWKHPTWTPNEDGEGVLSSILEEWWYKGPLKDTDYGGHTVLATGYDNAKEQLLCQNFWGPNFSKLRRESNSPLLKYYDVDLGDDVNERSAH